MKLAATQSPAIGLLLAGSLCLLPFLLPYHQQPVLSFHPEWLAVALGTAAALAALASRNNPAASWPVPARWLAAFALLLVAQATIGGLLYPQPPLLGALYIVYAALMIWLGAQLSCALDPERVAKAFAAFLLAGALANALAGTVQFYGRPELLKDVIAELHGSRAYGNIAQPNLYANYLALGESALLFFWARGRVRTLHALPAFALLVVGSALSGSRGALLYALWFAVLGAATGRAQDGTEFRRLKLAAYCLAGGSLLAHLATPWFNALLNLGPPGEDALDRLGGSSGDSLGLRLRAWLIALRLFTSAPLAGVGFGEFAGAAFDLGLDPSLTQSGQVWTSPHNLPLQLLAETGVVGATLALGGLCAWGRQAVRRYCAERQLALWWIIAAVGVEMIHSLVEFPMWSAHFLGVTALLMGAAAGFDSRAATLSRFGRIAAAAACATLAVALAILLRDYVRLDAARVTGTTVTLARAADVQRDSVTMRELTRGLMAPLAELWIVKGASLDRRDLVAKLAMSERAMRYWPDHTVVARRVVFLAFDAEAARAQELLGRALRAFPYQRGPITLILEEALAADKTAIEPLLVMARSARAAPQLRE